MKKFVSMMMAAAMIFALAVPAFAATSKGTVKATLKSPTINLKVGTVAVTANPYRIKITSGSGDAATTTQEQIINKPVACINKSDVGLKWCAMIVPTKNNNVTFVANATDATLNASANSSKPCAYIKVAFLGDTAYTAESTKTFEDLGATYNVELNGTLNVKSASTSTGNDGYGLAAAAGATDADKATINGTDLKAMTLVIPTTDQASTGNAIWVGVDGALNTNFDWSGKFKNSNNVEVVPILEFDVVFDIAPVANAT